MPYYKTLFKGKERIAIVLKEHSLSPTSEAIKTFSFTHSKDLEL
jgi:hypothetical protein